MRVKLEDLSSPKLDRIRFQVVVVLWTIVLLISPLWYHLTQVYRASIPFEGIRQLLQIRPVIGIRIGIDYDQLDIGYIQTELLKVFRPNLISFTFDINKSVQPDEGIYNFKLMCGQPNGIIVHKDRCISLSVQDCTRDAHQALVGIISTIFATEYQELLVEKEKLRVLKYSQEYQLVFSLLVGNRVVRWKIEEAVHDYFQPLLNAFENITSFRVSSQIQYYAPLPIVPKQEGNVYTLSPTALKQFINSAEWNFASFVSNSPPIHFVAYVPSKDVSPLQIVNDHGDFVKTNSFLVYQWGGISVQNLEFKDTMLESNDLKPLMEIFAYQLRILLGVEPIPLSKFQQIMVFGVDIARV